MAQVERHSVQDLSSANLEIARQNSVPDAAYELHTYLGQTPSELRPAMLRLRENMSTDVPTGDVPAEGQSWDEDRLRDAETTLLAHSDSVTTIATHSETGEPGGYTQLVRPHENEKVVYQSDTIVNKAHRGHRLGLALKSATLLAAREAWPQAERIHTWNAAENDHMWRVNQLLGYQTSSVEAIWQKQLRG